MEWTNRPLTDVCISAADTSPRPLVVFESALLQLLPLPATVQQCWFPPPTAIRDPGAAPSLASPLHHHPLQTSPRAQSHRRPESNSVNAKMCRCSTRGGADIKMDGRGDRHGLQHWQVYLFVKEEAIKHGWVFRRQGGLSLTGKWVKSKNVSLLLRDISSCCPRANNKTHTDSFSCSILTLRLTQQEKSLFWLL